MEPNPGGDNEQKTSIGNGREFIESVNNAESWRDFSGAEKAKQLFGTVESFTRLIQEEENKPLQLEKQIVSWLKNQPPNNNIKINKWERKYNDREAGVTAEIMINGEEAKEISKGAHAVVYEYGDNKVIRVSDVPSFGLQQVIGWELASEDARKHLVEPEEYGRIERDGYSYYYIVMQKGNPLRVTRRDKYLKAESNQIEDFDRWGVGEELEIVEEQQEELIQDVGKSLGSYDMFSAKNIGIFEGRDGKKKLKIFDYGHWKGKDMRIWLSRNISTLSVPYSWTLAEEEIGDLVPQDILNLYYQKAKHWISNPIESKFNVLLETTRESGGVEWKKYGDNVASDGEKKKFKVWSDEVNQIPGIGGAAEKYTQFLRGLHDDVKKSAGEYVNKQMEKVDYHSSMDPLMNGIVEECKQGRRYF